MISDEDALEFLGTLKRHFMPRLTDWEYNFVQNVQTQVDRRGGQSLSDKQREKLDEILTRCARTYTGSTRGDEG